MCYKDWPIQKNSDEKIIDKEYLNEHNEVKFKILPQKLFYRFLEDSYPGYNSYIDICNFIEKGYSEDYPNAFAFNTWEFVLRYHFESVEEMNSFILNFTKSVFEKTYSTELKNDKTKSYESIDETNQICATLQRLVKKEKQILISILSTEKLTKNLIIINIY